MRKALCILASDFLTEENRLSTFIAPAASHPNILEKKLFLMDRDGPDGVDPDHPSVEPEKFLQLLPYISLINEKDEILIYTRGEAGGETGLHGLCSIGIGGHPEIIPSDESTESKACALAIECIREINEEVGYPLSGSLVNALTGVFAQGLYHVIYDGAEDGRKNVGRRHLGLFKRISIHSDDIAGYENGVITKAKWLKLEQIQELINSGEIELEGWSRIILEAK